MKTDELKDAACNLWAVIYRAVAEFQAGDPDPARLRILIEDERLAQAERSAREVAEAMRTAGIGTARVRYMVRHLPGSIAHYIEPPAGFAPMPAEALRSELTGYGDLRLAFDDLLGSIQDEAQDEPAPATLTPAEDWTPANIATCLGVTEQTVRRWCRCRKDPCNNAYQVGQSWRIPAADFSGANNANNSNK